ncbi:MAG: hypothetical protein JXA06_07625 [Bacteroidetes bacterium]|nr:hypothetical protein [Bacteroidota bacterium]
MRQILFFPFLILIFLSSLLTSCKDTITDSTNEIIFPDDSISFTKHVGPLLQRKCASHCHGGTTPSSGLNLEYPSYSALLNWPGLVIPGNADGSRLFLSINGKPPFMPPEYSEQLTENQIAGIKKWIDEGAEFN